MFKRPETTRPGSTPDRVGSAKPPPAATTAKLGATLGASSGKQAYEARRAAKAGVTLDRWMADKQKRAQLEHEAARRASVKQAPRKPGFLKRLLDRAHKPL